MKTIVNASVDIKVVDRLRNLISRNLNKQSAIELPVITIKHATNGSPTHKKMLAQFAALREAQAKRASIPTRVSHLVELALADYLDKQGA